MGGGDPGANDRFPAQDATEGAPDSSAPSRAGIDGRAVGDRLRADHGPVLDAIAAAADAVAADRGSPSTDGRALAAALERRLADEGTVERLPALLRTAVDAADLRLVAEPVAAPPYVAVTSRGPVLRGSTADGRLVVVLQVFAVERDPTRYVPLVDATRPRVSVSFRPNDRSRYE